MKKNRFFHLLLALTLVLSILVPASAFADSGSATYDYLFGTGFLCDLEPSACPAIAGAPNGDTIEITGEGTFSIHPDSATGSGTFTHKDANGNVLASGTWTATELLSFHSYGSGTAQGFPEEFEGGKALLRVHLTPEAGGGFDAVLRITCLLGDKIPAGAEEGVRLNVQGGLNFNQEVSGLTLFVLQ